MSVGHDVDRRPRTGAQPRLLVFARAPVPGLAKTRLMPLLGAEGAAIAQARFLRHTLATAKAWRDAGQGEVELWCAPDARHPAFRECARDFAVPLMVQAPGDLGARMWLALCASLLQGAPAVLIGTDCPWLTPTHIDAAHLRLAGHDGVFVPADDGGYVLAGLARAVPELFAGVAWGSAGVMAQTRARARLAGASIAELAALPDVDTPRDWARLKADPRFMHLTGV